MATAGTKTRSIFCQHANGLFTFPAPLTADSSQPVAEPVLLNKPPEKVFSLRAVAFTSLECRAGVGVLFSLLWLRPRGVRQGCVNPGVPSAAPAFTVLQGCGSFTRRDVWRAAIAAALLQPITATDEAGLQSGGWRPTGD